VAKLGAGRNAVNVVGRLAPAVLGQPLRRAYLVMGCGTEGCCNPLHVSDPPSPLGHEGSEVRREVLAAGVSRQDAHIVGATHEASLALIEQFTLVAYDAHIIVRFLYRFSKLVESTAMTGLADILGDLLASRIKEAQGAARKAGLEPPRPVLEADEDIRALDIVDKAVTAFADTQRRRGEIAARTTAPAASAPAGPPEDQRTVESYRDEYAAQLEDLFARRPQPKIMSPQERVAVAAALGVTAELEDLI
jgi:hypothetical protein